MNAGESKGADAFERSREHRRGVRQASLGLGNALARPASGDPGEWYATMAMRFDELAEAFGLHVEHSEGPGGLLSRVVDVAPRLAHAADRARREHRAITAEIDRLKDATGTAGGPLDDTERVRVVREGALALLGDIERHRQRGSDLIWEAYAVDVEGGESG